ncbi:STAS domain-containing protein [Streptomyces sp. NPDC002853]
MTLGAAVCVQDRRGALVVAGLSGALDYATEEALRADLSDLVAQGARTVVLDMADVVFFDSSGIRLLLGLWHRVQNLDGSLSLTAVPLSVQRILSRLGLDCVLPVYDTAGAALAAHRAEAEPCAD